MWVMRHLPWGSLFSLTVRSLPGKGSAEKEQSSSSVADGCGWIEKWMVGFAKSGPFNKTWHIGKDCSRAVVLGKKQVNGRIKNCFEWKFCLFLVPFYLL